MKEVVGIDAGSATVQDAEHLLGRLLEEVLGRTDAMVACTHFVRGERPHVALSVTGVDSAALVSLELGVASGSERSGPPELAAGAALAAAAFAAGEGRAVIYPGVSGLVGTRSASEVLAESAIEEIDVMGGGVASLVHTRDFVRPEYVNGRLVLLTQPAGGGGVVPFEVPNPTPCCADH
ncbi:hypothetical protein [Tenggerimyces flavus]|uniref:Uncharacterized protein n=1 Tax=Tenggerimyces flavus TaxID=1708749 RepID=A0ABV7Y7I1_9ACTN|nr:hypothetical protein [Tenggerimyces flavus]MBM7785136.1 hypothetical protein [Tenggerimyces flavus]